jgi:hypothetical protein
MLNDGFTASEGTGHTGGPALGDWKEGVNNTLTGNENSIRRKALGYLPCAADGPLLH